MTTTEKRKFNWALFIITFLFCFPVAIGYALWFWLSGTRIAKIGGNGLLMIFAVIATINTAALVTIYYFLPALLLSIAMIVFTILSMKGIKPKLFTILNAVSILLIFTNIAFFGGWLYNIGIMFALPIGLIGAILSLMGLRKSDAVKAEETVEEPTEESVEEPVEETEAPAEETEETQE